MNVHLSDLAPLVYAICMAVHYDCVMICFDIKTLLKQSCAETLRCARVCNIPDTAHVLHIACIVYCSSA